MSFPRSLSPVPQTWNIADLAFSSLSPIPVSIYEPSCLLFRLDFTDTLAASAQGFRRGANRVRKQMWWKDMRMRIAIGVGIAILLIVIIVPIVQQ